MELRPNKMMIDYETRSEADLKRVGSIEYAKHASTEIICVGYKINNEPAKVWVPNESPMPDDMARALVNTRMTLIAHNAGFEQAITRWVLSRIESRWSEHFKTIPHERWKCTAVKAATHALPRNLEAACRIMGLEKQKDTEGKKLLKKYYKPRKATKANKNKWHDDEIELMRIYEYCLADVEAQHELDAALPDIPAREQALWCLDQEINFRGVRIDVETVKIILEMADKEAARLRAQVFELSNGAINSATEGARVLKYCNDRGAGLTNIQKQTVEYALEREDLDIDARMMLELRLQSSMTSLGKYEAMIDRVGLSDRARDLLLFSGASTWRWTGRGIQPQNFPRGIEGLNTAEAIEVIRHGDPELVRLMYGDLMGVLSSCLRGMLIPTEGHEFFCADYAGIEARILFWLADHQEGLKGFIEKRDMYKEMASVIFNVPIEKIGKGEMRDLGKRAFLGCGYGMGAKRFLETCFENNMPNVTPKMSDLAVKAYRKLHHPVPTLWSNIEKAAITAVKTGKKVTINRISFFMRGKFLICRIPCGRELAYCDPRVIHAKNKFGGHSWQLLHWAEDPKTKQWVERTTWGGVLVENIIQAIACSLMSHAMPIAHKKGYKILITVHDEILGERLKGKGSVKELEQIMATLPPWAEGAPVVVEGWGHEQRYRK